MEGRTDFFQLPYSLYIHIVECTHMCTYVYTDTQIRKRQESVVGFWEEPGLLKRLSL